MSVTVRSSGLNDDLLYQGQIPGANRLQSDIALLLAQSFLEAQHQLLAAVAVEVACKGGVLDAVQAVVLAALGDLVPDPIVRDVVDHEHEPHYRPPAKSWQAETLTSRPANITSSPRT